MQPLLEPTDAERVLAEDILSGESRDAVVLVATARSSLVLHLVARDYNWDGGFDVPRAILRHIACDLGTALLLFWSAEPEAPSPADTVRTEFLNEARSRVETIGDAYKQIAFDPAQHFGWNGVYLRKLQAAGFERHLLEVSPGRPLAA